MTRLATGGRTLVHRVAERHVDTLRDGLVEAFAALNTSEITSQPEQGLSGWVAFKADLYRLFGPLVTDAAAEMIWETAYSLSGRLPSAVRQFVIVDDRRGVQKRRSQLVAGEVEREVLPAAQQWIADYGARRVQVITQTTQEGLRDLLQLAYREGWTIPELAAEMRQVPFLGLTKGQSVRLLKRRAAMLARGIPDDRVRVLVTREATRLLRRRVLLIAKHESLTIGNVSQNLAWQQMGRDGWIDPTKAKRAWVTTPTACPTICEPMEGVRTGLTEPWSTSVGSVYVPQESHVGCNCTEMLAEG